MKIIKVGLGNTDEAYIESKSLYVAGAGRYKALHNEKVHGGTVY